MYRKALISPLVLKGWDDSIFEYFRTPAGVDKEITIDNILLKTAEMTTIYTHPDVFKQMVKIWVNKRFGIWQKLYDTTKFEYNPIHNYDREEEYTENTSKDFNSTFHSDKIDNFNRNLAENYERNLSDRTDNSGHNSNSYNDKREKQVAAFNDGLTDSEKENTSGSGNGEFSDNSTQTATGTTVTNQTGTTNGSENYNKNEANSEQVDNSHNLHAFGNIGVTTTQQMIEQERNVVQFDIIDYITDDFITNFCIMIY